MLVFVSLSAIDIEHALYTESECSVEVAAPTLCFTVLRTIAPHLYDLLEAHHVFEAGSEQNYNESQHNWNMLLSAHIACHTSRRTANHLGELVSEISDEYFCCIQI